MKSIHRLRPLTELLWDWITGFLHNYSLGGTLHIAPFTGPTLSFDVKAVPDLIVGGMVFNGMERTLTPSHNLGSHTIKHLGKSETTGNFSTLIIRPLGDLTNISMSGYVVLLIETEECRT